MTASPNTSFDLSRTGILRVAFQMAGVTPDGQDPNVNQIAAGSDILNIVLKGLENNGIILRRLERTTQALVSGQVEYATASDTLDIDGRTIYVSDGLGTDLPLKVISRGEYMELTNKETGPSQPVQIYVERATTISFFLYPPPSANWTTITYPRTLLLTDMDSGPVTTGLASKYLDSITLTVASRLALRFGLMQRYQALKAEAEEATSKATNDDTERGGLRFVPDYGRRFSR